MKIIDRSLVDGPRLPRTATLERRPAYRYEAGVKTVTGLAIRTWLDRHKRLRYRALFDFATDSKLRGCDIVKVWIGDVVSGGRVRDLAVVVQQKAKRLVQFELMDTARKTMRHGWSGSVER